MPMLPPGLRIGRFTDRRSTGSSLPSLQSRSSGTPRARGVPGEGPAVHNIWIPILVDEAVYPLIGLPQFSQRALFTVSEGSILTVSIAARYGLRLASLGGVP